MEAEVEVIHLQAKDWWQPQELEGTRKDSSLWASQRAGSCQHLGFRLLGSRIASKKVSVVLSHPVCGT